MESHRIYDMQMCNAWCVCLQTWWKIYPMIQLACSRPARLCASAARSDSRLHTSSEKCPVSMSRRVNSPPDIPWSGSSSFLIIGKVISVGELVCSCMHGYMWACLHVCIHLHVCVCACVHWVFGGGLWMLYFMPCYFDRIIFLLCIVHGVGFTVASEMWRHAHEREREREREGGGGEREGERVGEHREGERWREQERERERERETGKLLDL